MGKQTLCKRKIENYIKKLIITKLNVLLKN